MPTGYTAAVEDGSVTELKPFVLHCARAFGYLATMREDPLDGPIPDEIHPSDYYGERLAILRERARRLESMTVDECAAEQSVEIEKARAHRDEYLEQKARKTQSYTAMLEKVRAWKEPSPEHAALKRFMLEALDLSMDTSAYEPSVPLAGDPEIWRAAKLQTIREELAYTARSIEEELDCAQQATRWVQMLKASL